MNPDDLTPDQAERLRAALLAYADGALGEMDQARLDHLLAEDPQLRQRLATLRQRGARLQELLSQRPAPRRLSVDRRAAVLAEADEAIRRRRLRQRRLPWERYVVEAAVLVVCVAGALVAVGYAPSRAFGGVSYSVAVAEIPQPVAIDPQTGPAAAELAEPLNGYRYDQVDGVATELFDEGRRAGRKPVDGLPLKTEDVDAVGRSGFAQPGSTPSDVPAEYRWRQVVEVETDIESEVLVEEAVIEELDLEVSELETEDPAEGEYAVKGREEVDMVSEMGGAGAFAQIGAGRGVSGAFGYVEEKDATTAPDAEAGERGRRWSGRPVPSTASDIVGDLAAIGNELDTNGIGVTGRKRARPGWGTVNGGLPVEEGQGWPSGLSFPGPKLDMPVVTDSRVPRLEDAGETAPGRLFDGRGVSGGNAGSVRESRPLVGAGERAAAIGDKLSAPSEAAAVAKPSLDDSTIVQQLDIDGDRIEALKRRLRRQGQDAGDAAGRAEGVSHRELVAKQVEGKREQSGRPPGSLGAAPAEPPSAPAAAGSDWRIAPPVGPLPPVNPWVLTDIDRLSTFALDTDSASLQLTSRSIREAVLPPAEQVRVEEFVNAFDYHYPSPSTATFGVQGRVGPSPWRAGTQVVQVGVKGRVIGRDRQRPLHLVVVLDASGSMQAPDRLPMLQRALHRLIERFGAHDRLSLVRFGGGAQILLEAASGADRSALHRAIEQVQADGSTDLLGGLRLGYELAERNYIPGYQHRVLLGSDGVATIGNTDLQELVATVAERRRQGIACSTVGVGAGSYDDQVLEQLANRGDGSYHYLADATAVEHLVERLAASLQVIAYDAKIQVDFDPTRVRRYRLLGYENRAIADADFRNDQVDAGEVGSGESATALYEIELIDPRRPATIGAVGVRYRDVAAEQVREDRYALRYDPSWRPEPSEQPHWYLALVAAQFAELLRGSAAAPAVGLQELAAVIWQVQAALPHDARVAELGSLIEQAGGLPRRR